MTLKVFNVRKKAEIFVINHTRGIFFFPQLLTKMLGKKIVLITGGTLSECTGINSKSNLSNAFQKFVNFFERITYFLSDVIIVYSESEIDTKSGLKQFKNKIKNCGTRYVDTDIFKINTKITDRENIIGYVGRFSEEKGIRELIQSIPQISKRNPEIKFLFVGEGPLSYLIDTNLQSKYNITFEGLIAHHSLPFYLNEMKILIIPSFSEGLPKLLLEAMACGTPILSTQVGAIPDIIKDSQNGFIMLNNSPDCITKNVIRTIEYPQLDKVVANAKKTIDTYYTFENALQRYRAAFGEL